MFYKWLGCAILSATILTGSAQAEDTCAKMLIPKVTSFQSHVEKWLALRSFVNSGASKQEQEQLGVGYAGFDLSYADAQQASSYYQNQTHYSLSESQSISIASSELPVEIAHQFVDCVRGTKADITLVAPPGAENDKAFQLKVLWTPQYPVAAETTGVIKKAC